MNEKIITKIMTGVFIGTIVCLMLFLSIPQNKTGSSINPFTSGDLKVKMVLGSSINTLTCDDLKAKVLSGGLYCQSTQTWWQDDQTILKWCQSGWIETPGIEAYMIFKGCSELTEMELTGWK